MNTIEHHLEQVRHEYLSRMTQGHGHLLQQVEQYVAGRTGKMLRPRLVLLSASTLGDDHLVATRTLLMATAVEMLHNASLLHDDVIDHASTRRGLPSVNSRWNNATAVLVGDYHLAQIMQLLHDVGDEGASELINRTVMAMCQGELLQQEVLSGATLDRDTYLQVIDGKTARLFSTAAALGNPALEGFGLHYGRVFQMRDDIDDHEAPSFVGTLLTEELQAATEELSPIPPCEAKDALAALLQ